MCTEMNVRRAFLCVFVSISLLAGLADAEIIKPLSVTGNIVGDAGSHVNYLLDDNPGYGPDSLQRPVGTAVTLETGDSLADALATYHERGDAGHQECWTKSTNDGNPEFVFDLTGGGDAHIQSIILWQYGNNGGGAGGRMGNSTREFELIFHTEAEGDTFGFGAEAVEFSGVMDPILGMTTADNVAQLFDFGSAINARYVALRIASNYLPPAHPDITAGGDRYGLGEVRFAAVPDVANTPDPANVATDVCPNVVLSWNPGTDAEKHDVYFGTDFDSVNEASTSTPLGVLVSADQTETYYPVSGTLDLAYGTTYYWRVDEVKGAPPSTVKGTVWRFSTEALGYQLPNDRITATADSNEPDQGPEKTLDLVGDLHSTVASEMWLSATGASQPNWIEYKFDKVYRLHEMWVWNHNTALENTIGLGVKKATIQYSTDGTNYTTLDATHEFDRAPGTDTYAHNKEVSFDGVAAQYVRITAKSNWGGGLVDQYGLSEVRFFYVPVRPGEPFPENEATDVPLDTILNWTPGREAAMHDVYLSTNARAVAEGAVDPCSIAADGACRATYDLLLELGRTYYWKVNEVNMVEEPNTWEGDIWSFSTPAYFVVDDMESYNTDPLASAGANWIFYVWVDGLGDYECLGVGGNGTGANLYAQDVIFSGGSQAMQFDYDNDGMVTNPCTGGEAARTHLYSMVKAQVANLPSGIGSDWRAAGTKALVLQFYGTTTNAIEDMWIELTDGAGGNATVTYGDYDGENPTDINDPSWHQWNINLQDFDDGGVNLTNVSSIAIGIGSATATTPGGSGVVYFDDIRLYPSRCILSKRSVDFAAFDYAGGDCAIDYKEVEVMAADWLARDRLAPPLMAWYKLDEGFGTTPQDSSGNDNHGTLNGAPQWMAGYKGDGSLQFNGSGDEMEVPYNAALNPTDTFTVAAWINLTPAGTGHRAVVSCRDDVPGPARGYILYVQPDGSPSFWTGYGNANAWYSASGPVINEGQWIHVAATYEVGTLRVYVDGVMEDESTAATYGINTTQEFLIGAGRNENTTHAYYFQGLIDDVRMYDRTLSQSEIASIMDGTLGSVSEYHPLWSLAELDATEPQGSRAVNFKDFAVLVSRWLDAGLWP